MLWLSSFNIIDNKSKSVNNPDSFLSRGHGLLRNYFHDLFVFLGIRFLKSCGCCTGVGGSFASNIANDDFEVADVLTNNSELVKSILNTVCVTVEGVHDL